MENKSSCDQAADSLSKAVREELEKKAKLGQDAVVNVNGKPVRVKASELIKEKLTELP
ncbi:MAG: hypothetical protein JEZ07_04200 [Phycisphaerae bacterium]|nr:hypothetical protein [Phycisphaerae bacterium]